MNKANVLLLVVVSSLLTYISTATQPAATAGVPQEKWEYARSFFYNSLSEKRFGFISCSSYRKSVVLDLGKGEFEYLFLNEHGIEINRVENFEDAGQSKTLFLMNKEFQFEDAVIEAFDTLGNDGWHPYQVIRGTDYYSKVRVHPQDDIYWRRRVQ